MRHSLDRMTGQVGRRSVLLGTAGTVAAWRHETCSPGVWSTAASAARNVPKLFVADDAVAYQMAAARS
jgi:hypothetical protein